MQDPKLRGRWAMPRRWNERSQLFASIKSHQTDLAKIFHPSIDIGGRQQYEELFASRKDFQFSQAQRAKLKKQLREAFTKEARRKL